MQIGVDFDGVIADTSAVICDVLSEYFDREVSKNEIQFYCLGKCFNLEKNDTEFLIDRILNKENSEKLSPVNGAVEFLEKYVDKYGLINIITARDTLSNIMPFFEKYCPDISINLYSSNIFSKGHLCKLLNLPAFIDDCLENVISLANSGIECFIFDQPYNRIESSRVPRIEKFCTRIFSWAQMEKFI